MYDFLVAPFEYLFMKRALVGAIALSLGSTPIGVFLVLRRMSLMGDALSHAILPGAAIGFLIAGFSIPFMSLGGMIVGLIVALLAGLVSRFTHLPEDASFAGFFLTSLALGVMMVSLRGTHVDLIHVLFGTILAVDRLSLLMISGVTSLTLILFAIIYRPFVLECFDPIFFKSLRGKGGVYHSLFIVMVVANLVIAFQALGTLMAMGLMMIPAISARFWAQEIPGLLISTFILALMSSYGGLLISYHSQTPSGPSIILVAGLFYALSLLLGSNGSVRCILKIRKAHHHE